MTPEIEALPFDQLRTLHREIGALIAQKRHDALDELRERASILGFTAEELAPKNSTRGKAEPKYRNPDDASETWTGRGKRPAWLTDALDQGHNLEEFLIQH